MNIIKGYPPNYEAIVNAIGKPASNFMFTYGHDIYFPMGLQISPAILVHEMVHERQQTTGFLHTPEKWWKKYLKDTSFRYEQELEAYREQWQFVQRQVKDREMRNKLVVEMARFLSSSNYGNVVTFQEALEQIKK